MVENRSRKHHQERLGEALHHEIATIVEGELADPRITPASVADVQLAPDGKAAHVRIAVAGDAEAAARAMEGLLSAKNHIRHEMAERLGLRHPPELVFTLDRSAQIETRIDELLQRVQRRDRKKKPGEAAKD